MVNIRADALPLAGFFRGEQLTGIYTSRRNTILYNN